MGCTGFDRAFGNSEALYFLRVSILMIFLPRDVFKSAIRDCLSIYHCCEMGDIVRGALRYLI